MSILSYDYDYEYKKRPHAVLDLNLPTRKIADENKIVFSATCYRFWQDFKKGLANAKLCLEACDAFHALGRRCKLRHGLSAAMVAHEVAILRAQPSCTSTTPNLSLSRSMRVPAQISHNGTSWIQHSRT